MTSLIYKHAHTGQIKNVPLSVVLVNVSVNHNAPTTVYKEYQQIGLTRKGQKDLERIMLDNMFCKKRRFIDTFYNKPAMLENEWNFERHNIDTDEKVSIVKTITDNVNNPQSFSKQANKTEMVVAYEVNRLECDFGNYSIEMDDVTFPKGDPHFTCTINYKNSLVAETDYSTILLCSSNLNYPVRSKLVEYFYRHDREFYDELVKSKIVADCEYHVSLTLRQIEEANKRTDVKDIMSMVSGTYNRILPESTLDLSSISALLEDESDEEDCVDDSKVHNI